jgi:hypothetical protein
MRALSILAIAFSIVAGAASAQVPATDTPAAVPPQKIICVRSQADTGSHMGASKVCHTEAEWAAIHGQAGRMMDRYDTLQNRQMPAGGR